MGRKLVLTSVLALAAIVLAGSQLTDGDGLPGNWMLVYFGYTHYPDACPTAPGDIASALELPSPAERATVVPVSSRSTFTMHGISS